MIDKVIRKIVGGSDIKFEFRIFFILLLEGLDQWCELGFYGLSYSFLPVFLMVVDPSHKSSENSLSESFGQP
jgi:hypothetical protein